MKRKPSKYYMLCSILLVVLFLYGCGNDSSMASGQEAKEIKQEEIAYVTQDISLPEYASFDGAYSDGSSLYYAAAEFEETTNKHKTSFYILKQGASKPEQSFSLPEGQRVHSMTMDESGNVYYIGYKDISEEEQKKQELPDLTLYKTDRTGTSLMVLDLQEYGKKHEQSLVQGLAVDEEDRIMLFTSDQNIYVLNPNGELLFEVRTDGPIYDVKNSGGKIFAAYSGIDGIEVREVDSVSKQLSSKLPINIPGTKFHIGTDNESGLLIATESSVYKYEFETGAVVKKFDWNTYDFMGITTGMLLSYGENGVLAVSLDYSAWPMKVEAIAFRKAKEGETALQEKTVLILGTPYPADTAIKELVVDFNKGDTTYKIEIKDYKGDYALLNTEIISGKGPDILVLPSSTINTFASSGVLENLVPYFDADETLSYSNYQENIINAFKTDERLYGMPVSFVLNVLAGKTSVLGERTGWTLEELIAFAEEFPEGTDIFDNASKSGVLRLIKTAYANELVDMDNIDDPLDKELLIKMLEFANRYENDDRYTYNGELDVKAAEGRLILLDDYVGSGSFYRAFSDSIFGEPVSFIGYPIAEGNGNLIYSRNNFAINAKSEHKDIAWKFISILLSEDGQIKIAQDYLSRNTLPIHKKALEMLFTYWWPEGSWNDYIRNGDFIRYRGKGLTDEDLEPIADLIQNADTPMRTSPDIDKIIEEEAIFYFDGTKPLEGVVDVIENRIRIYVNEMK